jgi:hypothetical protein
MDDKVQTRRIASAKAYFEKVDNGALPLELFTRDFEFYFPKYGVGRGPEEFREFAAGLWDAGLKSQHHRDELRFIVSGQQVIVEGATTGSDAGGRTWDGGKTPGGRFCSVFDFTDDGLISRMFIYLDPDYTSLDADRFHWKRASVRW